MQRETVRARRAWRLAACAAGLALLWWARAVLWKALVQLFFGMLFAAAALPLMRRLEKRLPPSLSASAALIAVGTALVGAVLLLAPLMGEQLWQLAGALPSLLARVEGWRQAATQWLAENGIALSIASPLTAQAQGWLADVLPKLAGRVGTALSGLSRLLLAPVFAFYFLRDRREISQWLLLLCPVGWRTTVLRALREMRRELQGFLRGQLLVSGAVGGFTALGLLLCGVPAWLLLGLLMGVLELIPYVGPFIGGALAVLFALPGGMGRTLWALGVVVLVQQAEGSLISPQLMSGATRLHPIWVLLCVLVGGSLGGVWGILAAVPALLCLRAAVNAALLHVSDRQWRNFPKSER